MLAGFVAFSLTPHTITVDADLSDWNSDELIEFVTIADNNTDYDSAFYFTWDSNFIYVGANATYVDNVFFVYIDTNPSGGSTNQPVWGRVLSSYGDSFPDGFRPDYVVAVWTSSSSGYGHKFYEWNGTDWVDRTSNFNSTSSVSFSSSSATLEISVSRTLIGFPGNLKVAFYADNGSDLDPWKTWLVHPWANWEGLNSYPLLNSNATYGGGMRFAYSGFFHFYLDGGVAPSGARTPVDVSIADWQGPDSAYGVANVTINSGYFGEWVWSDFSGDERDPGLTAPSDLDIIESGFSLEKGFLSGYVKFSGSLSTENPVIVISIDTDQNPADSDYSWTGDDAETFIGNQSAYWERDIMIAPRGGYEGVWVHAGGTWWKARSSALVRYGTNATNAFVEFRIGVWDLFGDDSSGFSSKCLRMTLFTAVWAGSDPNSADTTVDYYGTGSDAIDVVSFLPAGDELYDNDIDFYFDIVTNSTGSIDTSFYAQPLISHVEIYPSGTYYLSHPLQGFNLTADSFSFVDYSLYDGTAYTHRPYTYGSNQTSLEDSWTPDDFQPGSSYTVYLSLWNCQGLRRTVSSNFSISTRARKVDGDITDWIASPGGWEGVADIKTDASKGNEWIFNDPLGDERSDGTDPDSNYDIDWVAVHSTNESLYFLVKFSDITSSALPLVSILIDNSTSFNSTDSTDFGGYADTKAIGDFSWALVVSSSSSEIFDIDSGWTALGGVRSYISDTNDVVEISVDREAASLYGDALRFALIVAQNNGGSAYEIGDSSVSDAIDVMSVNVGKGATGGTYNTWGTAIGSGDSSVETLVILPLDASYEIASDSSLPTNPDKIYPVNAATDVPVTLTFQWNASSSSDPDDDLITFLVVGDDTSSFSATNSSSLAFYRGLQPWSITGNWSNEDPLQYGTTYSWQVWAVNSRLLAYNVTSGYWRFTTASPARVVDGDPTDWATGTPSANYTAMTLQKGGYREWVYFGTSNDRRTDTGTSDDADLIELHLTCDSLYLYGLVKVADLQDNAGSKFHLSILLDADLNPSDPKGNWIGDDADTFVPFGFQFGERVIDVHGNGTDVVVELFDPDSGSSWWTPSDAVAVGSTVDDVVEFRMPLSQLGIYYSEFPKVIRITAVTFTNVAGWNNDVDTTYDLGTMDAVDVASGFPAYGYSVNAWDRDISDGKIDWSYAVRLSSDGAYAVGPDGDYAEWTGVPSTGYDNATVSQNEWIWRDSIDDNRKDIPDAPLDLREVRIKGFLNYAKDELGGSDYLFIKADIDNCSEPGKPLLLLGFATGTVSSSSKMQWFADDSGTTISLNAYPLDFQVMVGLDGAWFFAADSSNWYRPSDVYYFIITDTDTNQTRMEVAIPVSRLGYSSLSDMVSSNPVVYVALGAYAGDGSPDAIDKTRTVSYGTSDVVDLASFRGSTWDEVQDHTVSTWFRLPFVSATATVSYLDVQAMSNNSPNVPASLGPYGDVAEYPVSIFAKWSGLPDPDSGDAVSFGAAVVNGTTFYTESMRISYSGASYYVLAWDLEVGATYTPEKFILRDDVGSKIEVDFPGASFTVLEAYKRIDGFGEDWLSGSPEVPYTAYLDESRNEWSFKDAVGDTRSSSSWADLWKVRLSVYRDSNPSTADYLYGFVVFYSDVSLTDLLLVIAIDNGTGSYAPLPSEIDNETYLKYSSLMVVSGVGNPVFNSTDVIGFGVSYVSSNVAEFRFPIDQIGIDGVSQINIAVLLFERDSGFLAKDYSGPDVVDITNFVGSSPWEWEFSSSDHLLDNQFALSFNTSNMTLVATASMPSVGTLSVQGEINGEVYAKYPVLQWNSTGSSFVVEIFDNSTGDSYFLGANRTQIDLSSGPLILVPGRSYSFRVYPRDAHARAGSPTDFHSFVLYSPAREVDGDLSDWFAPPPPYEDTASLYAGEWFFLDERGDVRTDSPSASTNFDIVQFRVTSDDAYIYFLAKFAFVTSSALPYLSLAIDVDPDSDSDGVWITWMGDESSSAGSTPVNITYFKPDYVIDVYSGGIYIYNGTSWWTDSSLKLSVSESNSCFEFAIPVSLLGISLPSKISMAVASAQHDTTLSGDPESGDATRDFYLTDFLDVVSYNDLQRMSAWDADLSDGEIDSFFIFNVTSDGVKDDLPVISSIFPPDGYESPYLNVEFYWDDNDTDGQVLGRKLTLGTDEALSKVVYSNYTSLEVNASSPMRVSLSGGKTYFSLIEVWDNSFVRSTVKFAVYVKPVVGPEGGTLQASLPGGEKVLIEIPEGAFSDYVELVAEEVSESSPSFGASISQADSSLPDFISSKDNPTIYLGFVLSTNSSVKREPSKKILLKIFYTEDYENIASEQRLKIWSLDESQNKWSEVQGSRCIVRANYVEAYVSASGVYRVMEAQVSGVSDLSQVIVFPSIVVVSKGDASVKFDMLPQGAVVEVYSTDGRKFWVSSSAPAFGRIEWNLEGTSGRMAESGLYFYRIIYGDEQFTGRIVIVR